MDSLFTRQQNIRLKNLEHLQKTNLALSQIQILDSSKLKESADDNFKSDEIGRKFSEKVKNTGKRRNCL